MTAPSWSSHGAPPSTVLVHNIIAPYRVGLFNELHETFQGRLTLFLGKETHPKHRSWNISSSELQLPVEFMRTYSWDRGGRPYDFSVDVWRRLARLRPRVVILTGYDLLANWQGLYWSKMNCAEPVIWNETSSQTIQRRGRPVESLRKRYLSGAKVFLVPGAASERLVREYRPDAKAFRAPNSVSEPGLRRLPRASAHNDALFLGELSKRKGFDLVLAGASQLLAHFRRIHIAGTGPLGDDLDDLARQEPRVVRHGFVHHEDLVPLMTTVSTLLLPSRFDPWPLSAIEALVARRSLVLGPGVGSAEDLRAAGGDSVQVMAEASASSLVSCAIEASKTAPPKELRGSFTHADTAEAFLLASQLADELRSQA